MREGGRAQKGVNPERREARGGRGPVPAVGSGLPQAVASIRNTLAKTARGKTYLGAASYEEVIS